MSANVGERGRLVVDLRQDEVPLPGGSLVGTLARGRRAAGVLEPRGVVARKAVDEDVVPAVGVEVVGEREEVVGVAEGVEGLGRVVLVPLLELRAREPERPGDDVGRAILVEVADAGPLGEEPLVEPLLRERDPLRGGGLGAAGRGRGQDREQRGSGSAGGRGIVMVAADIHGAGLPAMASMSKT